MPSSLWQVLDSSKYWHLKDFFPSQALRVLAEAEMEALGEMQCWPKQMQTLDHIPYHLQE